jgi:hypothetical protein
VALRMRPLTPAEQALGERCIWTWDRDANTVQQLPGTAHLAQGDARRSYAYDYVCPPTEQTPTLYKQLIRQVVLKACCGYNGNVFAYGQTASGKTYTTLGDRAVPGIVLLAIGDIFHYVSQTPTRQFLLTICCVEIYNEQINDLLGPGTDLKLAVNGDTGDVRIRGAKQEYVRSVSDFIGILLRSQQRRKVAATDANQRSSRSHTLFRISIESKVNSGNASSSSSSSSSSKRVRSSLLTFVDLAGSESISNVGSSKVRQAECRHINKSLFGLKRVVMKLAEHAQATGTEKRRQQQHVPFRDSKLTRILKPALGGNSQTLFVCTMTPTGACRDETHNTMRFGQFANKVQNVARVNESKQLVNGGGDEAQKLIREHQRIIAELRRQFYEQLRGEHDKVATLRATTRELQQRLESTTHELSAAQQAAAASSASLDKLELGAASNEDHRFLQMKLKIAEGQVRLLEEQLVPLAQEARTIAQDENMTDHNKVLELHSKLLALQERNEQLEAQLAKHAERLQNLIVSQKAMRARLSDAKQEQAAAEQAQRGAEKRLRTAEQTLLDCRKTCLQNGVHVEKICVGKPKKVHFIDLQLDVKQKRLRWGGNRSIALTQISEVRFGQQTDAFARACKQAMHLKGLARLSVSLITAKRSLDLIMPSDNVFQILVEGLRPMLRASVQYVEAT